MGHQQCSTTLIDAWAGLSGSATQPFIPFVAVKRRWLGQQDVVDLIVDLAQIDHEIERLREAGEDIDPLERARRAFLQLSAG